MSEKITINNLPNVVILVLDAVRARNLSCYGYKRKTTPNLDRFAQKNVLYKNAISTSSWTLPSVTSIFTGMLSNEHKILNINSRLKEPQTIASELKSIGYETIAFSNVGWVTRYLGLNKGFEKFFELDKYSLPKNFFPKSIILLKSGLSVRNYGAETVNKQITKWFKTRQKNKPFFLYVHYIEPHFPYNPPRPFHNKFGKIYPWNLAINDKIKKNEFPYFFTKEWKISEEEWKILIKLYDGEIAYLDKKIGEILQLINDNNNLIFITADHGECLSDKRDLHILQHQFGLYDDLVKVPLLVKYPDEKHRIVENQVQLSDIAETIYDQINKKSKYPDRNLIVKEKEIEKSYFAVSEYIPPVNVLKRIKDSKISEKYRDSRRSIRTNFFKYIESKNLKEFFDLKKDPLEYNNLYSDLDEKYRRKLKLELKQAFRNI